MDNNPKNTNPVDPNVDDKNPKGTPPVDPNGGKGGDDDKGGEISFTPEQQKVIDEMMDKRFAKVSAKYESMLEAKELEAQKKIEDAERKAKMSAEERKQVEMKEKEEELNKQSRELKITKNELSATKEFEKLGLDSSLVEFVISDDEKVVADRTKKLAEAFNNAVAKKVEAELKGTTPTDPKNPDGTPDKKVIRTVL